MTKSDSTISYSAIEQLYLSVTGIKNYTIFLAYMNKDQMLCQVKSTIIGNAWILIKIIHVVCSPSKAWTTKLSSVLLTLHTAHTIQQSNTCSNEEWF